MKPSPKNEKFKEKVTNFIQTLRTDFTATKQVKKELHHDVDAFLANHEKEIGDQLCEIEKYIKSLNISEKYIRIDRKRNQK